MPLLLLQAPHEPAQRRRVISFCFCFCFFLAKEEQHLNSCSKAENILLQWKCNYNTATAKCMQYVCREKNLPPPPSLNF